jgi:hypothetical protein
MHGGRAWVDTGATGACFVVELPASPAPLAARPAALGAEPGRATTPAARS